MTKEIAPSEGKAFEGDWVLCQAAIKVIISMKKVLLGYQNFTQFIFILYQYGS